MGASFFGFFAEAGVAAGFGLDFGLGGGVVSFLILGFCAS